jgi:hypothetical protein
VKTRPYLLAYMAGITVPTLFLLVIVSLLTLGHGHELFPSLERFAFFPMAIVPNAWGAWNLLRLALPPGLRLPLGLHGGLLAVLVPLLGAGLATAAGLELPPLTGQVVAVAWPVVIAVYFLAWKYLVGYLNDLLGIHA